MSSLPHAAEPCPPENSVEVRDRLVDALRLDFVGPWSSHPLETERLPNYTRRVRPSNWYLTGFIVPTDAVTRAAADAEASDDLDETPERAGTAEESSDDGKPARRGYFPSSMGISFLIDDDTCALGITIRWGDYAPAEIDDAHVWSRIPREESEIMKVPVADGSGDWEIPRASGLVLHTVARSIRSGVRGTGDPGLRSVSVSDESPKAGSRTGSGRGQALRLSARDRGPM